MLHTWLAKPRNSLFRRALAMRAILWAAQVPRASNLNRSTHDNVCSPPRLHAPATGAMFWRESGVDMCG